MAWNGEELQWLWMIIIEKQKQVVTSQTIRNKYGNCKPSEANN